MGTVEVEGTAATAAILDMAEERERERERTSREFLAGREEYYRVTCE